VAVVRSSSAGVAPGPSPVRTTPAVTTVRDQSIVRSCAATALVATRSTIPALASTRLMSILLLLAMSFQERVERLGVEQPVRVRGTEPQLERTGFRRCVDQLDLLDQPIQPQAHRGVRDPVLGGEVLQRPPGQQASLQEAKILLAQVLNPRFSHVPRLPVYLLRHQYH